MGRRDQESHACHHATTRREERHARIRTLNDQLRAGQTAGRILVTPGVTALGRRAIAEALAAVRDFDTFNAGNDPHGEHDFGAIPFHGERLFWKIDYYDQSLEYGSPDPSSAERTTRVLTIMLASEY